MKQITQEQYYQLMGLKAMADELNRQLRTVERAAARIVQEPADDDGETYFGHVSDWIYGSRGLGEMLNLVGVEVVEVPPAPVTTPAQ